MMKSSEQISTVAKRSNRGMFIAVFAALSVLILGLGTGFYLVREKHLHRDIQQKLAMVADLKAKQINNWIVGQIHDCQSIMNDPIETSALIAFIHHPEDSLLKNAVLGWIKARQDNQGYADITIIDTLGQTVYTTKGHGYAHDSVIAEMIQTSLHADSVTLSDLHKLDNGKIHMDVLIPLHVSSPHNLLKRCSGALIIQLDPEILLYPLIRSWPDASKTAETLLLRQADEHVYYLNELRHTPGTALALQLPLKQKNLLGAKALKEQSGIAEGLDYRGKKVLGAFRPIATMGWVMVAKIDVEEALLPIRWLYVRSFTIAGLLILLAGFSLAFFVRNRQARYYQHLLESETERGRLSSVLQTSELRFKALFDSMTEGVALHNIVRNETGLAIDYQILEINAAFTHHTTIPAEPARGARATQLYQSTPPPYLDLYLRVCESNNPESFETWFAPLEKHFRISVFSFGKDLFATVFEDITWRKGAEAALSAEKERLLVTLRSIGDAVITTNTQGQITLMNRVAEDLTGWSLADALGKPLPEVFHIINEQTRKVCVNPVDKVLKTGSIIELANHTAIISKNGRERVIADSGAPIRDSNSTIIGVVLVFRDITEQQRTEASQQMNQRLEAIGVLAGGIAHDFNNLLSGLFGYLDMAHDYSVDGKNDKAAESLTKAISVFERARHLTRQLLTFSKGGQPIRKVQSLLTITEKTARFALSGSNITPLFTFSDSTALCNFDEHQMSQVIDNLVINARQAMPQGGQIDITIANALPDRLPTSLAGGTYVCIEITDQGAGISPEIQNRIFEPFFTTKAQGSGLGLATAFSIVKKHDGLITVRSTLGKGTTFRVFLPASDATTIETAAETTMVKHGTGRVLLMDDEPFILEVGSQILTKAGYEVLVVSNGDEAIALTQKSIDEGTPIHHAILDLTIPGGRGGKDTVMRLRELMPAIKVIASSGYSDDPIMAMPSDYGFAARLIKPYRKDEMLSILAEIGPQ